MPEPEIELAWAAGFFDGEGYVGFTIEKHLRKNKTRLYGNFRFSISQVHREPLDRFFSAVGRMGKVYGPYQNKGGKHKPAFLYCAYGNAGMAIFAKLRPYLSSIKRNQGDAAAQKLVAQQSLPRLGNGQLGRKRGPYKTGVSVAAT